MTNVQKTIKIGAICLAVILSISIFSCCFYVISLLINWNNINKEDSIVFEESYQNIVGIEIDVFASDILITSGDEFKVEALNIKKKFSSKVVNNTLKIEENASFLKKSSGKILITVSKDVILNNLKIDAGVGIFEINDIEVKQLEVDHGAGILKIKNSIFHKSDIDGGVGEIQVLSSIFGNLELDAGVGKTELEVEITKNSEINCGVGETEVYLLGIKENYSIKTEKGIGNIIIDGEKQENNTVYGNGQNRLEIEGGIGNIEINFTK